MDDGQFITRINRILRERGLVLPAFEPGVAPDGKTLSIWAAFLQDCVRGGIRLSDERWSRLTVERSAPVTVLALQPSQVKEPDKEFTVGLQLLMGMLERDEER